MALPTLGGVGAALVSVAAYSTQLAYMLRAARRIHGGRYHDYLVFNASDRRILHAVLRRRIAAFSRFIQGLGSTGWQTVRGTR